MNDFDGHGGPATCFVPKLTTDLGPIDSINLFSPLATKTIQNRVDESVPVQEAINRGLSLRTKTGLPFWDCANLACFETGLSTGRLISEALFHNGSDVTRWHKPISWLSEKNVQELADSLSADRILIISSKVVLSSGETMHIPMLDFHCPVSEANTALVEECIRRLGFGGGWIVDSGKSYHFYGRNLLPAADLLQFLAHGLLLSPITDRAWIAHQIIEGACGLRISKRKVDPGPPRIVSEVP